MLVPVDNSDRGCVIVATVRAMKKSTDPHLGVDANGCLTERVTFGSETIVLHHDDIPESDITLVGGVPCTTAIRTVIDIAAELRPAELETVTNDCLDRGLFTIDEMRSRLSDPDMARGHLVRDARGVELEESGGFDGPDVGAEYADDGGGEYEADVAGGAESVAELRDVTADGGGADEQFCGDLLVARTPGE